MAHTHLRGQLVQLEPGAGRPVAEATVLLFGEDEATWGPFSSYFRRGPTLKDGRYRLGGLRDGRYLAVAVPPGFAANGGQPTKEFFEALSKVATRVLLNPGETRTVDLPLVSFER